MTTEGAICNEFAADKKVLCEQERELFTKQVNGWLHQRDFHSLCWLVVKSLINAIDSTKTATKKCFQRGLLREIVSRMW